MSKITLKIETEDINTEKDGYDYILRCKDNVKIVITPGAIEKLIQDYTEIESREDD